MSAALAHHCWGAIVGPSSLLRVLFVMATQRTGDPSEAMNVPAKRRKLVTCRTVSFSALERFCKLAKERPEVLDHVRVPVTSLRPITVAVAPGIEGDDVESVVKRSGHRIPASGRAHAAVEQQQRGAVVAPIDVSDVNIADFDNSVIGLWINHKSQLKQVWKNAG